MSRLFDEGWRRIGARLRKKAAVAPVEVSVPSVWAAEALGFQADPAQAGVLDSGAKEVLLCCSRQWGKTTVTAVRALHFALTQPGSLTVCVAASERQSAIWMAAVERFVRVLGLAIRRDRRAALSVVLPNGSVVMGLPASAETIRGFAAVSFLIIDEAALVPDSVYQAVRPFRATTNGLLWMISTPHGQSGFFYEAWHDLMAGWTRFSVPATECPRISAEFLASEEAQLGPQMFAQEYLCEFLASSQQWITREMVEEAITDAEPHPAGPPKPLQANRPHGPVKAASRLYAGLDLGFSQDPTALAIVEEMVRPTGGYDHVNFRDEMETVLVLRHIQAYPLRTPYRDVAGLVERELSLYPTTEMPCLAVDASGVGLPVVELLRESRLAADVMPIAITSGQAVGRLAHATTVPKHVLLHNMRRMFEMGELRIPATGPGVSELMEELVALGVGGSAQHDDLAYALALALWAARPRPYVGERPELLPGTPGGDSDAALRYAERQLGRRER
jgi:hypothetical protein